MTTPHATVVLGSTGSIGAVQVDHYAHDDDSRVVALAAAGNNLGLLAQQAVDLGVLGISLHQGNPNAIHLALDEANARAGTHVRPEVLIGPDVAVETASAGVDTVVNAIRGIHGVRPSLAALESGADIRVANTETLLCTGVLETYLPHGEDIADRLTLLSPALAAIQDALDAHDVARIILTTRSQEFLRGRRRNTANRVNAATGFDAATSLLELRAITDVPIDVVEHDGPIASIVELADGKAILNPRPHLRSTWNGSTQWAFRESSLPAIEFAKAVADEGGNYPIVFYTANGEAVQAYLDGAITYEQIDTVVAAIMDSYDSPQTTSVRGVIEAAQWANRQAQSVIRSLR